MNLKYFTLIYMLIYFSISNLPLTTKMQLNVYTKKYSKQKEKGKPVTLKFSRKTGRTSGLEFGLFYISKEGTGKDAHREKVFYPKHLELLLSEIFFIVLFV